MEDKTVNKNEGTQEQAAEPVVKKEGFFVRWDINMLSVI